MTSPSHDPGRPTEGGEPTDGGVSAASAASAAADRELEHQRDAHAPGADLPQHDLIEEGVGALVVNTGLDGDAASG